MSAHLLSAHSAQSTSRIIATRLLCRGISLSPEQVEEISETGHWVSGALDQNRLEIQLGERDGIRILVPVQQSDAYRIVRSGDGWAVMTGEEQHRVLFPPPPRFYQQPTSTGRTVANFACRIDSTLVFLPLRSCSYGLSGSSCRFCRVATRSIEEREAPLTPGEVAETVRAAERERPLRHVYFPALPSIDLEDGGVSEIEPLVRAARRHTSALVAASVHPPRSLRWLDHAYAVGVDVLGIHLEIHDVEVLSRVLPGRARHLGKSRYLAALRHAARIFPKGAVWSEVVVGLQPIASVHNAIRTLLELGVVPRLVPLHNTQPLYISARASSSAEEIEASLLQTLSSLDLPNCPSTWLPTLGYALPVAIGPLPSFGSLPEAVGRFVHSRIESRFALSQVARIRRALRVTALDELAGEPEHGGH